MTCILIHYPRLMLARRQQLLDPEWRAPATEQAGIYLRVAKADNTRRAYRADWQDFTGWCARRGSEALPASAATLALYLTERADSVKVATLRRRLSAISQAHQSAGYDSPTQAPVVRQLMAGVRRTHGTAPAAKRPVLVEGRTVGIPFGSTADVTCPVAAVEHWRNAAGISTGPLFRVVTRHGRVLEKRLSGEAVGLVVKRWVEGLGYDPAQFGGHSLRAGLATSAAIAGKSERVIMQQTGHRSVATLRRYIPDGNLFRENAAEGLGL